MKGCFHSLLIFKRNEFFDDAYAAKTEEGNLCFGKTAADQALRKSVLQPCCTKMKKTALVQMNEHRIVFIDITKGRIQNFRKR